MALVVEDGSGLIGADALISLADCNSYHAAKANAAWTGEDASKEAAIRRATDYMSRVVIWAGYRTHGRAQALAWPRAGCFDVEGYGIEQDEIPVEIRNACAEVALQELTTPGSMTPVVTIADAAKRKKVGEIEIEYANASLGADARVPSLPTFQSLIAPFVNKSASMSRLAGEALRR